MKTIKERIPRIVLSAAFVLIVLGCLFIYRAFSISYFYIYFMLVWGIALIILSGIILLIFIRYSRKKAVVDELEKLNRMLTWTKYKLDLDTIRIKSNNWDSSRFIETQIYDIEIQEKNIQTILEFDLEINGVKKQFHWPSDRQPKSLEMYFVLQKETDFYLDPNDHSAFYLDLSFIPI